MPSYTSKLLISDYNHAPRACWLTRLSQYPPPPPPSPPPLLPPPPTPPHPHPPTPTEGSNHPKADPRCWTLSVWTLPSLGHCPDSEHRFPAPSSKEGCGKPVFGVWVTVWSRGPPAWQRSFPSRPRPVPRPGWGHSPTTGPQCSTA